MEHRVTIRRLGVFYQWRWRRADTRGVLEELLLDLLSLDDFDAEDDELLRDEAFVLDFLLLEAAAIESLLA